MLVWLTAAKGRCLKLPVPGGDASRHDAERNMRGIEPVVANRRLRIITRAAAMHESGGAERRFGDRTAINEKAAACADLEIEPARKLHEEVVRMLTIDERNAIRRFPRREQVRIAAMAHQRLQAQHRAKLQLRLIRDGSF